MRNLATSVVLLALALVACGPSNQELSKAKTARYQGDKSVLFNTAKAAVEANHKLGKVDEVALGFQTAGRWYTFDGLVSRGTDENPQDIPDRAIRMTLVVRLLPDGDNWVVQVEPSMLQRIAGSPQPQPLSMKDANIPGWAIGQVDTLHFEVHKALAQYEVKSPGGVMPAAPAPAPAAPAAPSADPAAPAPAQ